ncbi:oligosaccharide flippase family protein [Gammaproteobacteria bacterium]|nr:oligosaccharide flippase family protein [Gammaproteobacteria bacterium]
MVANFLGQGWSAFIGLVFLPVYIRYLGMEAFGLIGLFAVMQTVLTLLDLGMTPTLNREMARFTAGDYSSQAIRNLLRSIEMICYVVAIIIAVSLWAMSGYLANNWLNAEQLPIDAVTQALTIMALVVGLRFCEGIYRGSLFGLQRQVWYNAANAILATIRYGGAVIVLTLVEPTIEAFFLWQAFASFLTISVLATKLHYVIPRAPLPSKFSITALAGVWKFTRGMIGITFLAILLTQADKILLSRILTLENFGYYALSATVAGVIFMITTPIVLAIYPRMVELVAQKNELALIVVYHQGAQLVTALTGPLVILLCFYSTEVIFVWSGNIDLAHSAAPILSILVVGTFLNGLVHIPYRLQLAQGWTGLALIANSIAVAFLVPTILLLVPQYGAKGAAWIWVVLNLFYLPVVIQFMHRKFLKAEKLRWYVSDILIPVAGSVIVMLLARVFAPDGDADRIEWMLFLVCAWVLGTLITSLLANRIRPHIKTLFLNTAQALHII